MKETHCIFVLVVAARGTTPETKSATDPAVQPAFSQVVLEIENHEAARVRTYRMEATPLRLIATKERCGIEVAFGGAMVERFLLELAPPGTAATWQDPPTAAGRPATFSHGASAVGSAGDLMAFRYPETKRGAVFLVTGAAKPVGTDGRPDQAQACGKAAQGVMLGDAHARIVGVVSGPELYSAPEPAERLFRASLRL